MFGPPGEILEERVVSWLQKLSIIPPGNDAASDDEVSDLSLGTLSHGNKVSVIFLLAHSLLVRGLVRTLHPVRSVEGGIPMST